jgi:tetratricopeptide (TPR) repeat protein
MTRTGIFLATTLLLVIGNSLPAQQQPPGTTAPPELQPQQAAEDKAASALDEIEQKIAAGDFATAGKQLHDYLSDHPKDARAWFDSGFTSQSKGSNAAAIAAYQTAISINPDQFESTLALGLLYAKDGQRDSARPLLERAVTLTPATDSPAEKARAWRALAMFDRNMLPATASNALLEALRLTPETKQDTLLAAEIAESDKDYDAAEASYRALLKKDNKDMDALGELIHLLIVTKREDEAEPFLKQALALLPEDETLNTEEATLLLHQGKNEDAAALLRHQHEINPKNDAISILLADLLAGNNDAAGSEQVLAPLLATHPDDFDVWLTHGHNLVLLQQIPDAVAAYLRATKINPANGDGWAGLAFAASEAHQPAATLAALDNRDKFLPRSASSLFLRATANDSLHKKDAAVAAYKEFLTLAQGKFPNQEWQARQRIAALTRPQH